ncbi:hypothetical protein JM16_002188 [Phytophthora kernoviae]|uniref:Uncharacterized protein n=1 Tax=Phytophthora kernoviae TaxID=325452 RepID=A0A8T0LZC3_9STRA|nr:hypothetical protein JM16_002188 [Phytophthora kernoviae]
MSCESSISVEAEVMSRECSISADPDVLPWEPSISEEIEAAVASVEFAVPSIVPSLISSRAFKTLSHASPAQIDLLTGVVPSVDSTGTINVFSLVQSFASLVFAISLRNSFKRKYAIYLFVYFPFLKIFEELQHLKMAADLQQNEVDVLTSVLSAMTVRHDDDHLVTQRPAATLKEILEKIRANKEPIRELDLKDMAAKKRKLLSPGGDLVGRVFQLNRTVRRLLLPGHDIGDVGAQAMGKMLRTNNTLQHLDLRGNEITAEGAGAISDALYGHEALEHLGLSSNHLGDAGAKSVAQVLPYNISLKYLGLANNNIGKEGGQALLDAILQNRSLVMVQLVRNEIPQEILSKIRAALVVNKLMANKAKRDEEKELVKDEEREKELKRLREEVLAGNQNEEDSSSDDGEDDESLWI